MNVTVKAIPTSEMRYPTCGDWWYDDAGNMEIRVSVELPQWSQDLIVMHEYAEARMCADAGITQKQVDDFDMNYEADRKPGDESEPGDDRKAPYFQQHQVATIMERIMALQMQVDWSVHENMINALFPDPVPAPVVSEAAPPEPVNPADQTPPPPAMGG